MEDALRQCTISLPANDFAPGAVRRFETPRERRHDDSGTDPYDYQQDRS